MSGGGSIGTEDGIDVDSSGEISGGGSLGSEDLTDLGISGDMSSGEVGFSVGI